MITVVVVGEGPTEETFVRDVLAPALAARDVFLSPRLITTSRHGRGGALSRDRVLRFLRNTLRERADTYVTTMFDLYGLPPDFPGVGAASSLPDPLARAQCVEQEFGREVVALAGCRADRFLPHVQPYEFEGLLFADVDRLIELDSRWRGAAEPLRQVRQAAASPEHINDGHTTHPSARLRAALQSFEKVLHGPAAARAIGLTRLSRECRHFGAWLGRLEQLAPL